MELLQHLANARACVKKSGDTISREISNWCGNKVKIVRLVYGAVIRWL